MSGYVGVGLSTARISDGTADPAYACVVSRITQIYGKVRGRYLALPATVELFLKRGLNLDTDSEFRARRGVRWQAFLFDSLWRARVGEWRARASRADLRRTEGMSGSWLHQEPPVPATARCAWLVAVRARLGLPIPPAFARYGFEPAAMARCSHARVTTGRRCGAKLDPDGTHAAKCAIGGHVMAHHDFARDALGDRLRPYVTSVLKEQYVHELREGSKEARLDLEVWVSGKRFLLDVRLYYQSTARAGQQTIAQENSKFARYKTHRKGRRVTNVQPDSRIRDFAGSHGCEPALVHT